MILSVYCRSAVILYVIFIYAFYPGFHLHVTAIPHSLYQYLTQGFLSGHLNLLVPPSAELLNLPDPYDPMQNVKLRLHDASLYKGKYYLYFGPLPVVIFYLPFKWLTGLYPSDGFAAFFFLTLGFIASFSLMLNIKSKYFPHVSELQVGLAGLLMGFAGGAPFLLSRPLVYEVAIASAFCFMSWALFFLYRVFNNQYKAKDVALFSLFLSLTAAGRPHFSLICALIIPGLLIYLLKYVPKEKIASQVAALLIPSVSIGIILALYNYLRFGSIFECGHTWQLGQTPPLKNFYDAGLQISKIPRNLKFNLYYYFLQPYAVSLKLPYITIPFHSGVIPIDKDYYVDSMVGILSTTPFIVLILALPKLIIVSFKQRLYDSQLRWFLLFAFFIPCCIALILMMLPIAGHRYEVDFLPYFVMLSMIALWLLEGHLGASHGFKIVKMVFIVTAAMSIYIGLSFGLAYWLGTI